MSGTMRKTPALPELELSIIGSVPKDSTLIIKNSFLEEVEDKALESDSRRCNSEPPSRRNHDLPRTYKALTVSLASGGEWSGSTTSGGSPQDSPSFCLGDASGSPAATEATGPTWPAATEVKPLGQPQLAQSSIRMRRFLCRTPIPRSSCPTLAVLCRTPVSARTALSK